MKEWLAWLGRGAEKERAYARLQAVKELYATHGERVILLSRRTELARRTGGSTQKAFEFVEQAFVKVTQAYAQIGQLITAIEAGLVKGSVGDVPAVEAALKQLGPDMESLEQHLNTWERSWQESPRLIEEAALSLAELKELAGQAAARVGAPLPVTEQVVLLEQHLEKIRQRMASGDPIEAAHQVEDLRIAQRRVSEQVSSYSSGAMAITQAEEEIAELKQRLAAREGGSPEATGALAAAEALLARLRPALAAGRLDPFQADLLQLQRHLTTARTALRQ